MKKKIFLSLFFLTTSSQLYALDLVEAYQRAKQSDPSWQANLYQYQADQLNLGIARTNFLPTVSVSGNITRKHQGSNQSNSVTIPGFENFGDALMSSTSTTKQISITARQPLFRKDAWEGYKQVQTSVLLSEVQLRQRQQDHILNVAESYFNVLRQQTLTSSHLQEEKALLEQLEMMNAKLREGLVARSDVSEAHAQYQNARANRISSNVQLLLAQEQLAQLIGPYQESLAVLQENFSYQQPYPANLQEWTTLAQNQNLSVQQARLQQKYNDDQRRIERAALYPQLEAVATYGYTKQSPETLISGDGQFDQIGVEMNWNLFNGGRTQQNIRKATVDIRRAEAELEAAVRKSTTDAKQAYLQVQTDQNKLEARKAAMQSSELVSRASRAQYNEGLKTIVDVLLAQRNAFSARQDYVNAQYDHLINILRLKAAAGQLNEQDLQEMNSWLVEKF